MMIGHDLDQRLSLNSALNAEPDAARGGRGGADVQREILSQLSRAGGDIKGTLDRLKKQDPTLYAEAVKALQGVMGNSGINQLMEGGSNASSMVRQAMSLIEQGTETPMPMRNEMESAFGGLGDVRFMTGDKVTQALDMVGAEAAAFGNTIAARGTGIGKEALAEEVAHTRQQAGARGGAGGAGGAADAAMTNPSDVFEAEARQIAAQVAAGGRAPAVQQKSGDRVMLARRSWFSSIADGARSVFNSIFGGGVPKDVTLNIGGAQLKVPMPNNHSEDQKRVTLNTSGLRCPVPGMTLQGIEVVFNDNWEVQSGTVRASLQAGQYVSVNNVELTIGRGGQVNSTISGIQFNVGGIVSGQMDLRLGSGGISGQATITHSDIHIPGGLTLSEGQLRLSLQNGQITAQGQLTATVQNLGASLQFAAQLNGEQLSGSLTASITEPFTIADAVHVKSGSVKGQFSPDGFQVSGSVNFQVKDWVESTFQATYKYPAQTWDATGQLRQVQAISFGEVAVRDMVVSASVKDSQFVGLRATGAFTVPNFEGNIDCAYDAQAQIINGTGSIRATQEIPLGSTGAILKEAGGVVTIENNTLKSIKGAAKAQLPYQGQPTFEVEVKDGLFQMAEKSLGGTGAIKTLRDLQFGNPTGLRAEVKTGAGGNVTLANNQVTAFNTGITFTVHDAEGQFGTGNVSFNYTDQSSVSGEATFTLDSDYGVPDRLNGPGKLKAGSSLSATIQAGQLQSVQLKGAKMELTNPSGAGKVEAALQGTWDFQAGQLTADGKAEFTQPWVVATPWATLTLGPAGGVKGEVTTKIEENKIKKLDGSLPFECQIPFQGQNIDIAGLVKGAFNAEALTVTGDIEAAPKSAFSVTFADSSLLQIKPETKISAHIGDSQLEQMAFALKADYDSAGTKKIKLALDIAKATYVPATGFTGIGKVSLREDYEVDVTWAEGGKIKLLGGAAAGGASIEASLTNNALDWVKGQIPYEAQMKIQGADVKVKGNINGAYQAGAVSGDISATIAEQTTIPVGAMSGNLILKPATTVSAHIGQNNLEQVKFGLDAEYHRTGTPKLKVGVVIPNATYDATQGFSGDGNATLIDNCTLSGLTWTNGGSLTLKAGGTNLSAKIDKNNIKEIKGGILFETTIKVTNQDVNIDGKIDGAYDGETQKVSGKIDAALKNEPTLALPGGQSTLKLNNGTKLRATIGDTALQEAKFDLKADFTRTGEPLLNPLKLAIDMSDVGYSQENGISGKGNVSIKENCDVRVPWGEGGKVTLKGGAGGGGLSAELKNSAIENLDGKVPFSTKISIQNQKVEIDGNINGKCERTATDFKINGSFDAKLTSNPTFSGSKGTFALLAGTSVRAKVSNNELQEMAFTLKANYDAPAGPLSGLKVALDIPEAKYENEGGGEFTGSGKLSLRENWEYKPFPAVTLNLKKGGSISGELKKNLAANINGAVDFEANFKLFGETKADVAGKLNANYVGDAVGGVFSGDIDAHLKKDLTIAPPSGGAEFKVLKDVTKVKAVVGQNQLEQVTFSVSADYTQTGGIIQGDGLKLNVKLANATYTPDTGFNGTGDLTLKKDCDIKAGTVDIKLLQAGSKVQGTVETSSLKSMTGTLGFKSKIPVGDKVADVDGAIQSATYEAPSTFGGSVTATLKNQLDFAVGGSTLKILPNTTTVKATFASNEFKDVKFGLHAQYEKPADAVFETPLKLEARIQDAVYDAANGVSGKGSVDLKAPCTIKAGESTKVTLKSGSGISGEMEKNDVKQVKGNVQFQSEITIDKVKNTKAKVDGSIEADYKKEGAAASFGGQFNAKVTEDFDVGSGDNLLKIKGGSTNVSAKLQGSDVSEVKFNLTADYTRKGAPFDAAGMQLEVKLSDATYTKEAGSISGQGSIKLKEDAKLSFNDNKAEVVLKKGGNANADVQQNELKSFQGDVKFDMKLAVEGQGDLNLGGQIHADYTKESGAVNGAIDAALKKEFTITKDTKQFKVKPEVTKMRATIAGGALGEITADLDADYTHSGEPFKEPLDLNVKLAGANYKRETGDVGGSGSLTLKKSCKVGAGENSLTLKQGGNINATVEASKLKSFNGDVPFEASVKIATAVANVDGNIKANYDGDQNKVGGSFDAKVKNDFTLGTGANQLTVKKDTTNIKATVAENDLKDIVFNLDADYTRQASGPLLTPLQLNVKLTNATYTKESNSVTGDGSVTMKSSCEIKAGEGNKVTLKEGSTVSAGVKQNDLEKFEGSIGYAAEIQLKDQKANVSGQGNFKYAKQGDASSVSADISGKLDNTLTFGPETNKISVLNDSTNVKAKFADNKFDNIEMNLHAQYDRKGAPFEGNGLLLDATIQGAKYENATSSISGSGTLKLRENAVIKAGESTVTIKSEGSILQGTLASNELEAFKGRVFFGSNLKIAGKDVKISGNIAADYAKASGFGGEVFAKLDEDVLIENGNTSVTIKNDSDVKAKFTAEGLKELKFNLHAHYDQKGSVFDAEKYLKLDMKISNATYANDKISGTGGISLREACKVKVNADGSTNVTLTSGTLNGTVADNKLTSMTGNAQFESEIKIKEGSILKVKGGLNASYTSTGDSADISGNINAAVAEPCVVEQGAHKVTIQTDTNVSASLEKGAFKGVKFNLHADYVYASGETPLHLDLRLANGSYDPAKGFSGTGSVTLVDNYTIKMGESDATIKKGSNVSATVADNKLTKASGTFLFAANIKVADKTIKVDGDVTGDYSNEGERPLVNGSAKVKLAEPVEFTFGNNTFKVLTDTNVRASVKNNAFEEIKFDLHAHTTHTGILFATTPLKLDVQLKDVGYKVGEGFSGQGSIKLLEDCDFNFFGRVKVKIKQAGTQASGEVKNSELEKLSGQIAFESEVKVQGQAIKIDGTIAGEYAKGSSVSGRAEAKVKETTPPIALGSVGTITIFNDTQLSAEVKEGNFDNMKFNLHAEYGRTAEPAIVVDIRATVDYKDGEGFSGQAAAEVKSDNVKLLEIPGGYTLFLKKGSGAVVKFVKNELTEVGGTINLMLQDSEGDFIKASVTADYKVKDNQFNGNGSAEVVREKKLGDVGSGDKKLTLFVEKGTGANIDVKANKLQSIGGTVKVRADDNEGPFIRVALAGTFDAAGGTGFTGSGTAEILHDKKLLSLGDYEFWVKTGTGATVSLDKNSLKEVGGTINFLVKNKDASGAVQPFIEGTVSGTYKAEEGKFSGNGDVKLARDMEFDIPGGTTKIRFLKGSGGGGSVKDNKLEKLTGTLKAMVVVRGEDYLKVEAGGEYDAINNKLVYLDGKAELLQPIKLFNDKVIITKLSGNARIENNKLVSVGGSALVEVPGVSGFTIKGGVDSFLWRNVGGQDLYSGKGFLEIEKPGRVKGRVDAQINEDKTFKVSGEVELTINEMLKGMIGITMDQTFNPEIKGELSVKAELIKARDLFSFNQTLFKLDQTIMAGPVPIAVGAGAAFGFKVSTQPVVFEGKIGIEGFRPLEMNIPRFTAEAAIKTGLTAKAELIPWVKIGVGVGGLLAAGIKLKGSLSATAAADLGLSLKLQGDGNGVGGSVGVDLGLKISADLSVTPGVYCDVAGMEFEKDITTFNMALGELFSWNWGTSFPFGNGPAVQAAPPAKTEPAATKTVDASKSSEGDPSGELAGKYGAANDPGPVKDGPKVPGPEELKNSTDASKKTNEQPQDSKFDKMMKIGAKVGGIADTAGKLMSALGTAWTIMTLASAVPIPFAGPLAAGLYLVYLHISGKLTFGMVVQMFKDMFEVAKMLVDEGIITLPGWLKSIIDFFGRYDSIEAGIKGLIREGAAYLCEKFPRWTKVINQAADVLVGMVEVLSELIGSVLGGRLPSLTQLLKILGRLGGAIVGLIGAVAEVIGEAVMDAVKAAGEALGDLGRGLVNLAGRVLGAIADAGRAVWNAVTSW